MARVIGSVFALAVCVAAVAHGQAADPLPIDTDRPDFTDGTHSVARGRIQLELGYTYQQGRGTDAGHQHSLPEAMVRIGVTSWAEIRVSDNYLIQQGDEPGAASIRGRDDVYIGTKVMATSQRALLPALSFEVKATVPSGSAISAHRVLPGGALLLSWEASGPWSAGVEFFVTRAADEGSQGVASLSIQYQATKRIQLYGEAFSQEPIGGSAGTPSTQYLNSGLMLLLTNNLQLDARIGIGLNQAADRYFTGIGFAVRR